MTRTLIALALIATTLAHTAPAFAVNQAASVASGGSTLSGTDLGSSRVTTLSGTDLGSGH